MKGVIPSHLDIKKVLDLKFRICLGFSFWNLGFRAKPKSGGIQNDALRRSWGTDFDLDLCAVYNEQRAEVAEW